MACQDLQTLRLNNLPSIKEIYFEKKCCSRVNEFEVNACDQIESITIKEQCFSQSFSTIPPPSTCGVFHILNCRELRFITIAASSFATFASSFQLNSIMWNHSNRDLPHLEQVIIGDCIKEHTKACCFYRMPTLEFSSTNMWVFFIGSSCIVFDYIVVLVVWTNPNVSSS